MSVDPSDLAIKELGLLSYTEIHQKMKAGEKRIAELRAALLAVILAYDDDNDAPDPERALSDAIQSARAAWRGDTQ